ncbi:TPA: AAA domain-containing protein [Kluyvera ascorbata]
MATIRINGENRTTQLSDWTMNYHPGRKRIELTCHFHSGKQYTYPFSVCSIDPTVRASGTLLIQKNNPGIQAIEHAEIVGDKYAIIYYADDKPCEVMAAKDVRFLLATDLKKGSVFSYFRHVAERRVANASHSQRPIIENILRQLDKVVAHPDTVLEAYANGNNAARCKPENLVFPFGMNESQLNAVEQAFSSQISVIEGPPGTGKTQTILNILANILLNNGSVAVVSNNNTAVTNVYEKLEKVGLDYVVARLGSADNRDAFFASQPVVPQHVPIVVPDISAITQQLKQIKSTLRAQNEIAQRRAEIDELCIEEKYLNQWLHNQGIHSLPNVENYRILNNKITDAMVYMQSLPPGNIRWRDRFKLFFKFGILNSRPLENTEKRQFFFFALQRYYYITRLRQARKSLAESESILEAANALALQKKFTQDSMDFLREHLRQSIVTNTQFSTDNYQKEFDAFLQRYPIIGSSTHSIINSLSAGTLLDYVIIDEASQQDIVPGILALACARNVIVVGDRKQLPHVPDKHSGPAPSAHYDCVEKSLLDSMFSLYGDALPVTLLKEHYRCHPKIIQFCNKQFYDNELIAMTRDNGESALSLVVTARGNHERRNSNLRELESLNVVSWDDAGSRGFIAPYNAQVVLSGRALDPAFISATVHKFQGRECEEIVFSTVLDKKANERAINFVDDPQLINVAVSRAQKHFTLVTGNNVFTVNNQHIAALIRYMTYYADNEQIHHSPVVSAFDLLYQEYDHSLEKLKARLNVKDSRFRSEQIAAQLIRDALQQPAYHSLTVHSQILLRQLITCVDDRFTARQLEFMAQGASCDFVFYYKVGKQPVAVIEIDGGTHEHSEQRERDALKESILQTCGIGLLRLRTIDSQIEDKIAVFLLNMMLQERNEGYVE